MNFSGFFFSLTFGEHALRTWRSKWNEFNLVFRWKKKRLCLSTLGWNLFVYRNQISARDEYASIWLFFSLSNETHVHVVIEWTKINGRIFIHVHISSVYISSKNFCCLYLNERNNNDLSKDFFFSAWPMNVRLYRIELLKLTKCKLVLRCSCALHVSRSNKIRLYKTFHECCYRWSNFFFKSFFPFLPAFVVISIFSPVWTIVITWQFSKTKDEFHTRCEFFFLYFFFSSSLILFDFHLFFTFSQCQR